MNVLERALLLVEGRVKEHRNRVGAVELRCRRDVVQIVERHARTEPATPLPHDRRDVDGHQPPNVRSDDPAQSTDSTSVFEHALVRLDVGEKSRRLSGAPFEEVRQALSTGVMADDIRGEPSSKDRMEDGIQLRIRASARRERIAAE